MYIHVHLRISRYIYIYLHIYGYLCIFTYICVYLRILTYCVYVHKLTLLCPVRAVHTVHPYGPHPASPPLSTPSKSTPYPLLSFLLSFLSLPPPLLFFSSSPFRYRSFSLARSLFLSLSLSLLAISPISLSHSLSLKGGADVMWALRNPHLVACLLYFSIYPTKEICCRC